MPMLLEPWPGGRWFRDLGDGNGHLWGHVQAIKRPTPLEIAGPLMMSFAVASNVQYRLTEADGGGTLITSSTRRSGYSRTATAIRCRRVGGAFSIASMNASVAPEMSMPQRKVIAQAFVSLDGFAAGPKATSHSFPRPCKVTEASARSK